MEISRLQIQIALVRVMSILSAVVMPWVVSVLEKERADDIYGERNKGRQKKGPLLDKERARVKVADQLVCGDQYRVVVRSAVTTSPCSTTLSRSVARFGVREESLSPSAMLPKVPRPPEVSFEPASLEEEISRAPVFFREALAASICSEVSQ